MSEFSVERDRNAGTAMQNTRLHEHRIAPPTFHAALRFILLGEIAVVVHRRSLYVELASDMLASARERNVLRKSSSLSPFENLSLYSHWNSSPKPFLSKIFHWQPPVRLLGS